MAITLTKPTVGGSQGTWGTTLNTALDDVADALNGVDAITPDLTSFDIGGVPVTATAAELNLLDGVTATTAELNLLDGVTWTLTGLNGLTATVTQLNYVDATSSIQTQIDTKAALASPSLTGTPTAPTAAAGTDTTQLATTAFVKAEINDFAVGVDQTWQDVTGSRNLSTSYQNTTGRPIQVSITDANSSNYEVQVSIDALTWVAVGKVGSAGVNETVTSFVVPDDHYYRINGGSGAANVWAELR
jgi:hypothetical protein